MTDLSYVPPLITIVREVADITGIKMSTITGGARALSHLKARAVIWAIARKYAYSRAEILRLIDNQRQIKYDYHEATKRWRDDEEYCVILSLSKARIADMAQRYKNKHEEMLKSDPYMFGHDSRIGWKYTAQQMRDMAAMMAFVERKYKNK